jgi:hypothetical protein
VLSGSWLEGVLELPLLLLDVSARNRVCINLADDVRAKLLARVVETAIDLVTQEG